MSKIGGKKKKQHKKKKEEEGRLKETILPRSEQEIFKKTLGISKHQQRPKKIFERFSKGFLSCISLLYFLKNRFLGQTSSGFNLDTTFKQYKSNLQK